MASKEHRLSRREMLRLAGLAAAGSVLASCGPTPTPSPTPRPAATPTPVPKPTPSPTIDKTKVTGTFTISSHNEAEARKTVCDAFFAKNYPNLKPAYDVTPGLDAYFLKLQTQIAGGTPPDYMLMHETRSVGFSAQGLLLPLDDFQKANPMPGKPEDYAGLEQLKYKGKTYVWPATFANYAMLYNRDIFDKAGMAYPKDDWTWQDLLEICKKLSKPPDQWGITIWDDPGWLAGWYPILRAYGGETFNEEDTQCLLNTPEAIQTFDYMREHWCSKTTPTPAAMKQLGGGYAMFLEGRVGLNYFYTGYFKHLHENRKGGLKYGLIALPKGPKGRFIRIGGSSYAIPKASKFPQVAWELMRFMLGEEEGAQIAAQAGVYTARVDYFIKYSAPTGEAATMVPNWIQVAVDQAKQFGVFVRYSKISTQFSPMVGAEAASLADCTKTAAEVAKSITDKANQMLKEWK